MELSIIIVNWNSKDYLRKCLQSIYLGKVEISFEIVVVDGGSYDGCGEMLEIEFPSVLFIQSEKNIGFAKANNLGYERSRGDCLLFLNPDTEVTASSIQTLHRALCALSDAGLVGAKLLNTDGSIQTSCVQRFPTVFNQLFDSNLLRKAFPGSTFWGTHVLSSQAREPVAVEVLSGACLMIRRSTFESIGRFSKDYFMYAEDLDLCYKSAQAGLKNYYVPTAIITHHGGGSAQPSKSAFSSVMMTESVYRFLKKFRGSPYGLSYRMSLSLFAVLRLLLLLIVFPVRFLQGKFAAARGSVRKWLAILRWTLGLERWVSNYD